jgi:hypothetical protein
VKDQINRHFSEEVFWFKEKKARLIEDSQENPKDMQHNLPLDLIDPENSGKRIFNPFLELKGAFFI